MEVQGCPVVLSSTPPADHCLCGGFLYAEVQLFVETEYNETLSPCLQEG